jgi:N-acetylneuraminic acid mutarotase
MAAVAAVGTRLVPVLTADGGPQAAAATTPQSQAPQSGRPIGSLLVLLGTQGGPTINLGRGEAANAVVVGGKIYVMGGQHNHEMHANQLADLHRYDPATNAWQRLADLPTAKSHAEHSTFVMNGRIIMAGGQVGVFDATDEVVSSDPTSDHWSQFGRRPATLGPGFCQPSGNRIVVTSGNRGTSTPRPETWVGSLET